ncbi:MAG: GGDEF domain-containing phosphodiesterase [Lachnospiraceae bacterium]|nr:GGDEF domain-containing phosphodiesterase [Lachnospiraceae bacterium]
MREQDSIYVDQITGLPNANYFNNNADHYLNEYYQAGKNCAVVFFDIYGMHAYNARFGYVRGDQLLQDTARVIQKVMDGAFAARYSEDHILVVTSGINVVGKIREIHREILLRSEDGATSIKAGIFYCDKKLRPHASIAIDKARLALNYIGNDRTKIFYIYDDEVRESVARREYVLGHYQEAIEKNWIKVYYQPVVNTLSHKVCSAEALARWEDPDRGLLSPALFIETLEKAHLLYQLDLYVLEQVCKDHQEELLNREQMSPISVNLSRYDLEVEGFYDQVNEIVDSYQVPHEYIHFEITETALFNNSEVILQAIKRFHQDGYEVWLDDFGSGYSSLHSIQLFDFDCIKIDMKFLRNTNEKTPVVLSGIVDIAKRIGMQTLAEGVETIEQYQFLQSIGCAMVQGYYFSKPCPYDALDMILQGSGLEAESMEEKSFYQQISQVNFFDPANVLMPQRGERIRNNIVMCILVKDKDHVFVCYSSDAREDFMRLHGITNAEEEMNFLNRPGSPGYQQIRIYTEKVDQSPDGLAFFDIMEHSIPIGRLRVQRIAQQGDKQAYLIMTSNLDFETAIR